MFFIEKGCLRTWVNHDGKDITTQFFFEGDPVASIESFRTNRPSLYSIESLEAAVLYTLSQKDFQALLQSAPEVRKQLEAHLWERFYEVQQLFYAYLTRNPQQRYEALLAQHQQLLQRVPQHYIASYLGITPVSLSRIRNRR